MNTVSFIWHQRVLVLVAVATILTSASFAVPVSTLYLLASGLTYTQVFTLETVLVVSIMLCDLPTGRLADLTSDRAVLTCGYIVGAAASIAYATSTSFTGFLVANVLSGLGIALSSGADRSYLTSALGEDAQQRLAGVLGHFGARGRQEAREHPRRWWMANNQHRPHSTCGNLPPFSRLINVSEQYN